MSRAHTSVIRQLLRPSVRIVRFQSGWYILDEHDNRLAGPFQSRARAEVEVIVLRHDPDLFG